MTREQILKNKMLVLLTNPEIDEILRMSAEDEKTISAKVTANIYNSIDYEVERETAVKKHVSEKTYQYVIRVIQCAKSGHYQKD